MKTEIIPSEEPQTLQRTHEILLSGGLVAFPTDTVYGLGALAFNRVAVERIYAAKARPAEKAIPVLIGDISDLGSVSLEVSKLTKKLADAFWPGPLTLVIPKHLDLSDIISADSTVGVRIPNHRLARSLLRMTGPMAVSSANISGQPSPTTAGGVLAQLGGRIELIIDGGKTPGGIPSTVVDCTGETPQILRIGPISQAEIFAIIENDL